MIATLRSIELDLIFTAYFLKHREISADLFNVKFNLQITIQICLKLVYFKNIELGAQHL